jgi:hypothetical protein
MNAALNLARLGFTRAEISRLSRVARRAQATPAEAIVAFTRIALGCSFPTGQPVLSAHRCLRGDRFREERRPPMSILHNVTGAIPHCEAIAIEGDIISIRPDPEHEYVLETRLVAIGYGISETAIRKHKAEHADELSEGKHWFRVTDSNTNKPVRERTYWTKRGIIRLGFFIKSERAKKFRDAAEDLIVRPPEQLLPLSIADVRLNQIERTVTELAARLEALANRPVPRIGGPRPGSGRKATTGRTHVSKAFSMPPELLVQTLQRAKELKMNRSAYVRACIDLDLKHQLLGDSPAPTP